MVSLDRNHRTKNELGFPFSWFCKGQSIHYILFLHDEKFSMGHSKYLWLSLVTGMM